MWNHGLYPWYFTTIYLMSRTVWWLCSCFVIDNSPWLVKRWQGEKKLGWNIQSLSSWSGTEILLSTWLIAISFDLPKLVLRAPNELRFNGIYGKGKLGKCSHIFKVKHQYFECVENWRTPSFSVFRFELRRKATFLSITSKILKLFNFLVSCFISDCLVLSISIKSSVHKVLVLDSIFNVTQLSAKV